MNEGRPGVPKKQGAMESFFSQSNIKTSPFGSNLSAQRAYERAERIVAAVYLLTNHADPADSAVRAARSLSLEVLQEALGLQDQMRFADSPAARSLRSTLRHLISLVRMLAVSGIASTQNVSVVIEALDELGAFVNTAQYSDFSESLTISREDIEIRGPLIGSRSMRSIKDIRDEQDIKDTASIKDIKHTSVSRPLSDTSRQKDILSVLQGGSEMGIRDIWSLLPQYSEKMIQRELASLVTVGSVKKVGLKRWSRYTLIR